jgi:hypothetical protein
MMQKTLYEIQSDYSNLVAELLELDGELTSEMEMALMINKFELEKKAEAYALRILEFNGQAALLKIEAERLVKRAAHYEKTSERLKGIIDAAMKQFDVDKIKTPKVTLSFRKSETVEVPEEFAPDILRFVTLKAEIDKEKVNEILAAAVEAGNPVPEVPNEDMLNYFTLKAELSKTKLKDKLKEGVVIGDVMILEKKNLQIK